MLLSSSPTPSVLPPPTMSPPLEPVARFHRDVWPLPGAIGAAFPSLATVSIMTWLKFSERMLADTLAFELVPTFDEKLSMGFDDETPRNEVAPPTISTESLVVTLMLAVPVGGLASHHI
jgi:hypothetical protein